MVSQNKCFICHIYIDNEQETWFAERMCCSWSFYIYKRICMYKNCTVTIIQCLLTMIMSVITTVTMVTVSKDSLWEECLVFLLFINGLLVHACCEETILRFFRNAVIHKLLAIWSLTSVSCASRWFENEYCLIIYSLIKIQRKTILGCICLFKEAVLELELHLTIHVSLKTLSFQGSVESDNDRSFSLTAYGNHYV